MKLLALGSSSAGNCFVMQFDMGEGEKPFSIMVECGFPYQTIVKKATPYGIKLSELDGCLITHCHKDHAIAANDLAKRGIQIYATNGTIQSLGLKGVALPLAYNHPTPIAPRVKVLAFQVDHDVPEPAGFVVKTRKETVIFAIDSCKWLADLSAINPDYLFIEANYDPTLMAQEQFTLRKKAGIKEMQKFSVNERIKRSHMSIDDTLIQISKISKKNLKAIFLTHLSDHMSAPTLWKNRVTAMTGVPCKVARKDCGIE